MAAKKKLKSLKQSTKNSSVGNCYKSTLNSQTCWGQGRGSGLWRQENPQQLTVADLNSSSVSAASIRKQVLHPKGCGGSLDLQVGPTAHSLH